MNKCELIELLAKRTGFSKVCCLKVLEAAKETIDYFNGEDETEAETDTEAENNKENEAEAV